MQNLTVGDKFKSRFTGTIFRIKKICQNRILFEEIGNENHQLVTELGVVAQFYEEAAKGEWEHEDRTS